MDKNDVFEIVKTVVIALACPIALLIDAGAEQPKEPTLFWGGGISGDYKQI